MAKRQREWAKRARLELIKQLGGKCVDCGSTKLEALEIDHIFRRYWTPRKFEQSQRVSIYRREAREGKLTVRCVRCNPSKGQPQIEYPAAHSPTVECPF